MATTVIEVVLLILAALGVVALRARSAIIGGGPAWGTKEKRGVVSIAMFSILAILIMFAPMPGIGWGFLIWILPTLVLIVACLSMAIDHASNNIGDMLHEWTWGRPSVPGDPDSSPSGASAFTSVSGSSGACLSSPSCFLDRQRHHRRGNQPRW